MEIKAKLTSSDLKRAADEVTAYANNLPNRVMTVLQRLADKGISAGETTIGNFGQYVTFSKRTEGLGVVIVAQETGVIVSEWLRHGERVEAEVSPLLMSEFGAGRHAIIWEGQNGNTNTLPDGKQIGRGSFKYPDQIRTHAFQNTWWYMDVNQQWHQASGVTPTRPLYHAVMEIITQVDATAKEVFGNG